MQVMSFARDLSQPTPKTADSTGRIPHFVWPLGGKRIHHALHLLLGAAGRVHLRCSRSTLMVGEECGVA